VHQDLMLNQRAFLGELTSNEEAEVTDKEKDM
jgi:hypothetical protein